MKILILHQHYKNPRSGGAIRSYYLSQALVKEGHQCVVITSHNEGTYKTENENGVEVHYLPVPYDNSFGYFKRVISFNAFLWKSIQTAKSIDKVDRIYAISTPLTIALAARWISKQKKVPFIFEVGDLWPDAPIGLGVVKNPIIKWWLYRLEKNTYRRALSIVALSPAIREAILAKATGSSVFMVPNVSDCEFYKPSQRNPTAPLVVSYIGAVGFANGLDYFLACAFATMKAQLPVKFVVCGTGGLLERLKASAESLALNNVEFTGFVDREGVKKVLDRTDVVFVCYRNVSILETGSPNKFFDGLAAGKMIVTNFGGWVSDVVQEGNAGFQTDPDKPEDFANKIERFIADPGLVQQCQINARRLAEEKFERSKLMSFWVKSVTS